MAPFESANSYSPASTVAEVSSHEDGTACVAASVDHLTKFEYLVVDSVILKAIRKDRNAFIDLH